MENLNSLIKTHKGQFSQKAFCNMDFLSLLKLWLSDEKSLIRPLIDIWPKKSPIAGDDEQSIWRSVKGPWSFGFRL